MSVLSVKGEMPSRRGFSKLCHPRERIKSHKITKYRRIHRVTSYQGALERPPLKAALLGLLLILALLVLSPTSPVGAEERAPLGP